MRIQPWIKAVTGALLMATTNSPTFAQFPGGPPAGFAPAETPVYAGDGYAGGPGYPYVPGPAEPTVVYPQGVVPQGYQPWPAVSPYHSANVAQTQHYQSNGTWFKEIFYKRRTYFASVEAMAIGFRDGGSATVGSRFAQPLFPDNNNGDPLFPFGEFQDPTSGPFVDSPNVTPSPEGILVIDPRVIPYPALATATYNDNPVTSLYPIRNLRDAGGIPTSPGIQGRLGFMNDDYTGFMLTGWWGFENELNFSRGSERINNVLVTPAITTVLQGQNLSTLNGNVPLDNGEPIPLPAGAATFGTGSTAKYDVLYSMQFTTEAGGTNFSVYHEPLYRSSGVVVRPLWGARYLYIGEGFTFRGIDSGFNYSVDEDTHRPENATVIQLYDQFEARLANDVRSNIAGPEVGLRFDLGGTKSGFKIWGESIFGLNVNHEQIHLRGDNIGDPLVDVRFNGRLIPRILDDANFQSEFDRRQSSTHVSPLFQQSIFADMDILGFVPLIKKSSLFEDARFRVGYTLLLVGEVSRPADSIRWQGFPLFPEIQTERKNWWANQFTFAIDWHY